MPATARSRLRLTLMATACLCLTVAAVIGCASGVRLGEGPGTRPDAEASARKPVASQPAGPVHETITVELDIDRGPFAPRARGYHRPKPSVQPSAQLLAPLGPLAQTSRDAAADAAAGEPPVLVTLAESVKFDGRFPGENGNWTKWARGVEELVRQHQADPRPRVYEVAKEPDRGAFRERTNFFGAWVYTARLVRRIAPNAVMMGPSIGKHDGGYVNEFLKVAKEYDVLPDIVCWHEDNLKHDINGHVSSAGEAFWQDGTARDRVVVMASAAIEAKDAAGDVPIFMAQMERAAREQGWRPMTFHFGFKLSHLFTSDLRPRSVYHAWREYADLANAGRVARATTAPTVEGLAVWAESTRTARLLLGRNRTRVEAKRVPGDVTVEVKGVAATTAHVRARRLVNTGTMPSAGLIPAIDGEFAVKNRAFKIRLPDFASGDVYAIEITLRGGPATTRTSTAPNTTQGLQ